MARREVKAEIERNQLVVKDNDLIQKAKFNLTATQQRLIAYVISKIKPTDKELQWTEIKVQDFCELCGVTKDKFYTEFKRIIDDLDKKSFWVETDEKTYKFRWFSESEYKKGTGTIKVLLNSNLKNYLIDLSKNFTTYDLWNILSLKSKYSIRLYELFKSYEFKKVIEFDSDAIKELLFATNYKNFGNFRIRVLDKAISEINHFTDINVRYDTVTKGKKVIGVIFHIKKKDNIDGYIAYRNTIDKINERNNQIKGQMNIFDINQEEYTNRKEK